MSANSTPLVSILIPAYNAGKWIAETLRSALAQTWPNKEIIVVDDGSMDDTMTVARGFKSSGVQVVNQRNQGAAAARNEAFSRSSGQFIQWLDADDLLAPDKIERQMKARGGDRHLLSSEWGRFLYRPDKTDFTPSELWKDATPVDWLTAKLKGNLHMQTGTWLVSRELTEQAGPWDIRMTSDDDGEYFCRVLLASDGVRFVPGARVYYRLAGTGSLSYIEGSENKIRDQWVSMQRQMRHLLSLEDSGRTREACLAYLRTWFIHFYPEHEEIVAEAQSLAEQFGGVLLPPELSWKYSWVRAVWGWRAAKRFQAGCRNLRWSIQRAWDRQLSTLAR